MKYQYEPWSIERLVKTYDDGGLILNPPYQRNPIWSLRAQQTLIDTILAGQPMPNFFLLQRDKQYEVVDGQQRIRTIIGYWKNLIPDLHGYTLERRLQTVGDRRAFTKKLLDYTLSVCVLDDLAPGESIEQYYAKVNSTGLRLNRPELKKAEYFTTNFLRLLQALTDSPDLKALRLFSSLSSSRLNDIDFVSELVALLKYGITDKKEKVDELYEDDVTEAEYEQLVQRFHQILEILNRFDRLRPLIRTRYKQKNDFYSLFYFVHTVLAEPIEVLEYFYQVLIKIAPFIRPSQEDCEPLMRYALNCVTQSNSKAARQARHHFFGELLLNPRPEPNETQEQILQFLLASEPRLRGVGRFFTLNCDSIKYPEQSELPL